MKRLVVCSDGTWNTPDQEEYGKPCPTNVVRLRNCIAEIGDDGVEQRVYYHPGVGTEGGWFSRSAGGAYGKGLDQNIKSAYSWLATNYEDGDRVYFFGFSRGAYTVRSLGGMISACGLLDLREIAATEAWARIEKAYDECYRVTKERRGRWFEDSWPFHFGGRPVPIELIGVWDTVGALGIPNDMGLLNLLDDPERWRFHDTALGKNVVRARQAMALDEERASFTPTRWDPDPDRDIVQLWFAGVHADVGGGYGDCGLADIALKWMIGEAEEAGLFFRPKAVAQVADDFRGTLHHSATGVFRALRTRPRGVPSVSHGNTSLHPSVLERHLDPPITQAPYRPTRTLPVGEKTRVQVYARERWNATGVFLEPGEYGLAAWGEWLDSRIRSGPGGTKDGTFYVGEVMHVIGSAWGGLERVWKKVTGNEQADFLGSRRVEDVPWMALVGVVANDRGRSNPDNDGSPHPHQRFLIGEGTTLTVKQGGYLYAFANDAWATYDNNRGSVTLEIERC
jgi:hypothetical protein